MKLLLSTGLLVSLLAPRVAAAPASHAVEAFEAVQLDCMEVATGRVVHGWRTLQFDGALRYLVTDAEVLTTRLVAPEQLDCEDPEAEPRMERSLLGQAIFGATAPPFPERNDGVTHAVAPVRGLFLTVDLCPAPASKFASALFDALAAEARSEGRPIPVGLAITADWLAHHDADFDRLVAMQAEGLLDITWVNHSATHPYRRGVPDAANFLRTPGTVPAHEVLATEVALLERGQMPSPFFRFPGLVSDRSWVERLATYSLLPLGSDAWLANGLAPSAGSVILVHGNGNEPYGVTLLLRHLPRYRAIGPFLPLRRLFGGAS